MSHHDAERAERHVDEVRNRLIGRIDDLSDRLSTVNLLRDTMSGLVDKDSGEQAIKRSARLIREHPVSSALLGAGLVGLTLGLDGKRARAEQAGPDVARRAGMSGNKPTRENQIDDTLQHAAGTVRRSLSGGRRVGRWIDANRVATSLGALAFGAAIASLLAARRDKQTPRAGRGDSRGTDASGSQARSTR
ncbi:MAG: hypothetical protein R3E83_15335 [Burkholderiaceae bacterium]